MEYATPGTIERRLFAKFGFFFRFRFIKTAQFRFS